MRIARIVAGAILLLSIAQTAVSADVPSFGPVVLRDDRGATVRLATAPARIVSLAPSLTEIVFLLGEERRLVGVTRFCNYPPRAASLPKVGGVADPDVELIVSKRPDLVLCTSDGNPRERVVALEGAGIPCFAVAPQDLGGIFRSMETVADLLGVPEKGRREAEQLRRRAGRAARKRPGRSPSVLFVVSTQPIIAAGSGTFMDEIVRLAGGHNAAARFAGRYPRLSVEHLLSIRPDVVLIAAMVGVEAFPREVTRWTEVPAFRDGEIHAVDGDLVTRPGPRMVDALEALSRIFADWASRR